MERIIKASSNEGEIVLDSFVGSGTTCVVAKQLQRKWIGFDSNAEYIKLGQKRLQQVYSRDSFDPRENRVPQNSPPPKSQQSPLLELGL